MAIAKTSPVPLIGLDWKDDSAAARQWLSTLGNPYAAVATDAEGRVAIDWGVYGAPETFLIGPDGKVLFKHIAPMTMDVWNKEFLPRIQAAARRPPAGVERNDVAVRVAPAPCWWRCWSRSRFGARHRRRRAFDDPAYGLATK
jgi:hypothetical protein